jgi:hypothetical protein
MPTPTAAPMDFSPPTYSFEPELTGPVPRPLPDNILNGPYAQDSRKQLMRIFATGLVCFLLPYVPGMQTLSYYVVPLDYLDWIGAAALAIAAGGALHHSLRFGAFRYVKQGQPLVARVTHLGTQTSAHGQFTHSAVIAYRHPETGAVVHTPVQTKAIAPSHAHRYAPPFGAGDYVTAVYLAGKDVEKTIRLYAFLDLSPDVNIRTATDVAPGSSLQTFLKVVALFALFFVLFGNVYAMERYPLIDGAVLPVAVIAVAGGLIVAALLCVHLRWQQPSHGFRQLLGPAFGGLLIGGMSTGCWALMFNAWLDRSPTRTEPAEIVEFWTTTYSFLLRSYQIEYRLDGSPGKHKVLTTVEHMQRFECPHAVARIGKGAFGWEWRAAIEPDTNHTHEEEAAPR